MGNAVGNGDKISIVTGLEGGVHRAVAGAEKGVLYAVALGLPDKYLKTAVVLYPCVFFACAVIGNDLSCHDFSPQF